MMRPGMAWAILVAAGLLEVGWAVGLKYSAGFARLWPSVGTAVALAGSMFLLAVSLRTLPLGTRRARRRRRPHERRRIRLLPSSGIARR